MDGVDVWGRSPYENCANEEELKLRVLKTGDSMTGDLSMNGNRVIGLPLEMGQVIDPSEATSYKVVESKIGEMLKNKVNTTGDTMSGDLYFLTPKETTVARYLGCTGLDVNKQFTILMGNLDNSISYTNPGSLNIQSSNGTLFRLGSSDIIRFGTSGIDLTIRTYKDIVFGGEIDAEGHRITDIGFPELGTDAAPRHYVDDIESIRGVIPSLEANISKTGFIVSASSEYSSDHSAFNAFRVESNSEWATNGETSNFWIKITLLKPIRLAGIVLTGRASGTERIYNWRVEGSTNDSNWESLYTRSNTYIGSTPQSFTIDIQPFYQYFRLYVMNAESNNPGLSYFQLYNYLQDYLDS